MKYIFSAIVLAAITSLSYQVKAQQFVGLNHHEYTAVQNIPNNPAWVTKSANGLEAQLFSINILAGNNAYVFEKEYILGGFNGKALEGVDYYRDNQLGEKHLWANAEINGPAISYTYKEQHHLGLYTRMRQLYRGGNISRSEFGLIGQELPPLYYGQNVSFKNAGFTVHNFSEIGITYGRVLLNNNYHILSGGVSLKYMMGIVAGSIYTESIDFEQSKTDSTISLNGDLNINYTYNFPQFIDGNTQNNLSSWFQRAGRWGLGIDVGMQYQFHPEGNPNRETQYQFSIAASITDVGSIGYIADTGSGAYEFAIASADTSVFNKKDEEEIGEYLLRLQNDTGSFANNTDVATKFRVGLPTAFRLNADYNLTEQINLSVNILLNLRGNSSSIYRPAYVNYFNITPTYGGKHFKFSLPFSVIGYQSFTMGTIFRAGPLYIGSSSIVSSLMSGKIKNLDAFAGLTLKLKKEKYRY